MNISFWWRDTIQPLTVSNVIFIISIIIAIIITKNQCWNFPGGPVVKTSLFYRFWVFWLRPSEDFTLLLQGSQIPYLVRSHKLHSLAPPPQKKICVKK